MYKKIPKNITYLQKNNRKHPSINKSEKLENIKKIKK